MQNDNTNGRSYTLVEINKRTTISRTTVREIYAMPWNQVVQEIRLVYNNVMTNGRLHLYVYVNENNSKQM